MEAWFSERAGLVLGVTLGCGYGLAGALFGVLGGLYGAKGKMKQLLLNWLRGWIGLSALLLLAGLGAILFGQPYHVWYPLVVAGAAMFLLLFVHHFLKKRFAEIGLKKMDIRDS